MSLDVIKKIFDSDIGNLGNTIVSVNKFGTKHKINSDWVVSYSGLAEDLYEKFHDDSIPSDNYLDGYVTSTGSGIFDVLPIQGDNDNIYVTSITITNPTSIDYQVQIRDGSTTKMIIPAPAGAGAISNLHTPLKLSPGNALTFGPASGVTVSALGYFLDH